jgi:hypothetical protein
MATQEEEEELLLYGEEDEEEQEQQAQAPPTAQENGHAGSAQLPQEESHRDAEQSGVQTQPQGGPDPCFAMLRFWQEGAPAWSKGP